MDVPAKPEEVKQEEQVVIHTLLYDIKQTLLQLEKALANKELRQVSRIMKQIKRYKNVIQAHHLARVFDIVLPCSGIDFSKIPGFNAEFKESFDMPKNFLSKSAKLAEIEIYLKTMYVSLLYREKLYGDALQAIKVLLPKINDLNKRTIDSLNAHLYFFLARIYEKSGSFIDVREQLLEAYNKACLRSDEMGQATLINLILRNYMAYNNYEAAYNFIDKADFPENKSINEYCKYLYYTARIKAIRRDYNEALWRLNQAIRKAPDRAVGFKISCQRLAIVVELLLGEIPNREIFSEEVIFKHTYGYYKVIQAVIEGNLKNFQETVAKYKDRFTQDKLYTLIMRLNQIVIRVGLRKINNAYSRISLTDIANKLKIDKQDVEFVVAKAIRDGVVTGEINHDEQTVTIKEHKHVYMTDAPQQMLDQRTNYFLNLYQSVQKAITYPPPKIELERAGSEDMDPSDLMDLFDFDDDM